MKITPLEIRQHLLNKRLIGYDTHEVDALKELLADSLEGAAGKITALEEQVKDMGTRLVEHEQREAMLKDTITTAKKMVDDLKNNARKEAEIIIAEARQKADEIAKQANKRAQGVQEEIYKLRKQRIEIETSIKAILDYHASVLNLEEKESRKADEEADKLKFLTKDS
jgi:cell division initiation protein